MTIVNTALEKQVHQSLDFAKENGYPFEDFGMTDVANDLLDFDSRYAEDGWLPKELLPHVKSWFEVHPRYYADDKRHLICVPYSRENLHKMATDLGIKRCWLHAGRFPHYDIPKRKVTEILKHPKVTVISQRELHSLIELAESDKVKEMFLGQESK